MPHIVADRVLESTTSTGTGAITLAGALTGFKRFNAVCAIGDTVPYFIEAIDAQGLPSGDYEYGIATYTAANQLTRTLVMGSSNGGALVNFAAGSKNVGMSALASTTVPTGMLAEFLGSTAPTGWLERDGSLVSRAAFPALWAYAQASGAITASDAAWASDSGKFSPGDGASTFRLPDHRGEFMRGWDHGRGVDAGRALGSSQAQAIQSHQHTFNVIQGNGGTPTSGTVGFVMSSANSGPFPVTTGTDGGGAETRPRNVAVLVCIKT